MAINLVLYSRRTEECATLSDFFVVLDEEFGFTLDPFATRFNAIVVRAA